MWRRALVLGGIRSGKSLYAERLVASGSTSVRYVATARRITDDDEWNARIDRHRARRPRGWTTTEVGGHPLTLLDLLTSAAEDDTLLVEDLGTWIADVTEVTSTDETESTIEKLAASVRGCSARLVLVSAEVGLSVIPDSAAARAFADALGTTNQAIAASCDRVTLVIAGNAVPVKGGL
jgi:nicotinate-nucleotide--dimethylbenzimidazole phosphoribosyltransferase